MAPDHRPWWRVDADADESEKLSRLPSDVARWAWFRVGCKAKTQRRMGIFAGRGHLRTLLGTHSRYIPDLIRVGVLHDWPTDCERCTKDYPEAQAGDLVVHDYRRKQVDPTAAERQARRRASSRDGHGDSHADSHGDITPSSRALSPSPSMSPSDTPESAEPYQVGDSPGEAVWGIAQVVEDLTGRPFSFSAGSRVIETLRADVADLGPSRVEEQLRRFRSANPGPMDGAGLVFGAHKAMYPIPDAPRNGNGRGKGHQASQEDLDELRH